MTYAISRNDQYKSLEVSFSEKPSASIRDALKALCFRWHGLKKVWYGYGVTEDALRAALEGAAPAEAVSPSSGSSDAKADEKALQAALREEYRALISAKETAYRTDYYMKKAGHFVKLSSGDIVVIDKPRIETSFCFGESGYDFDEAAAMADRASKSESYFKAENLRDLKSMIDLLGYTNTDYVYRDRVVAISQGDGTARIVQVSGGTMLDNGWQEVSEADRDALLAGYRLAYRDFEKRLDAYLKRYGMSKIRTWTYWRDA